MDGSAGRDCGAITDPLIPVIANCTRSFPSIRDLTIRHELVDQVCRPVQWSNTVEYLGAQGVETFIEFGPGRVLTAIVKRMLRKATIINVNDAKQRHGRRCDRWSR